MAAVMVGRISLVFCGELCFCVSHAEYRCWFLVQKPVGLRKAKNSKNFNPIKLTTVSLYWLIFDIAKTDMKKTILEL